jgi:hypothetical protein
MRVMRLISNEARQVASCMPNVYGNPG